MTNSSKAFYVVLISALSCSVFSTGFAQQAVTPPACSSDNHRAFDFWLGEWQVSLADGTTAGANTLTTIEGGCAIKEEWRSATSSFTGTSYNFYDPTREQWRQLWLDNQGGVLDMAGSRKGKQMIMRTESQPNADGHATYHQITWTANDDDTVRQVWETFTQGQATVTVFDGLYVRAEPANPKGEP